MDFLKITNELKDKVKELSKNESSLKSISFSISEENKEFIVYFTWNKEEYLDFNTERFNFRNLIKEICKNERGLFNFKKSNPNKFVFSFKEIPELFRGHFSTNV